MNYRLPVGTIVIFLAVVCNCANPGAGGQKDNPAVMIHENSSDTVSVEDDFGESVTFDNLSGKWDLKYSGNYGYYFNFQDNYKALIILYLGHEKLAFKGVYSVEPERIKISIYEMKRVKKRVPLNTDRGFLKANSSSFFFRAGIKEKKGVSYLMLAPLHIRIDGNDSDGYFEPLIKLRYCGS